jgi:hypothetical protein
MSIGYEKIIRENLHRVCGRNAEAMEQRLPASREGNVFRFRAFAEECALSPTHVAFSEKPDFDPKALLVTLYALHVSQEALKIAPFKSFKEFLGSMPYQGAFTANSEHVLVPHVSRVRESLEKILPPFQGQTQPEGVTGDFSFLLFPLPKVALCYIFYLPDEDFPASVTCLFSSNAASFMPLDGLADVAEYSSRKIIQLI